MGGVWWRYVVGVIVVRGMEIIIVRESEIRVRLVYVVGVVGGVGWGGWRERRMGRRRLGIVVNGVGGNG